MESGTASLAERVSGLQKIVSEAELVRFRVSIDGSFAQVRLASGSFDLIIFSAISVR